MWSANVKKKFGKNDFLINFLRIFLEIDLIPKGKFLKKRFDIQNLNERNVFSKNSTEVVF